jgi:hypothetical protein
MRRPENKVFSNSIILEIELYFAIKKIRIKFFVSDRSCLIMRAQVHHLGDGDTTETANEEIYRGTVQDYRTKNSSQNIHKWR